MFHQLARYTRNETVSDGEFEGLLNCYWAGIAQQGRLDWDYAYSRAGTVINITLLTPSADALDHRYDDDPTARDWNLLQPALACEPSFALLGTDNTEADADWADAPELLLFSSWATPLRPARRLDTHQGVATYKMPLPSQLVRAVTLWAYQYKTVDQCWIDSRALQWHAYRQLTRPETELAQEGIELCREIEQAIHKPTYYYLLSYYNTSNGKDPIRPCPGCGGAWLVKPQRDNGPYFEEFNFRCDPCRLVSHRA